MTLARWRLTRRWVLLVRRLPPQSWRVAVFLDVSGAYRGGWTFWWSLRKDPLTRADLCRKSLPNPRVDWSPLWLLRAPLAWRRTPPPAPTSFIRASSREAGPPLLLKAGNPISRDLQIGGAMSWWEWENSWPDPFFPAPWSSRLNGKECSFGRPRGGFWNLAAPARHCCRIPRKAAGE